jgi:hypothetical protein
MLRRGSSREAGQLVRGIIAPPTTNLRPRMTSPARPGTVTYGLSGYAIGLSGAPNCPCPLDAPTAITSRQPTTRQRNIDQHLSRSNDHTLDYGVDI